MNNYINNNKIDEFIKEDVPYFDLTTFVLGIGNKKGRLCYITREKTVVACVEECVTLAEKLNLKVTNYVSSGTVLNIGEAILEMEGNASDLHKAWKVIVNILEYNCGIATRTYKYVQLAKEINSNVHILSTRKIFPGTKELAIKAVLAGGGYPHRLGLSESILIFSQHLNFIDTIEEKAAAIKHVKAHSLEKKVIVEAESAEDALFFMKQDIDGLQFDKIPAPELKELVEEVRKYNPKLFLLAAGGVNEKNIQEYAKTGVDGLVTTAMYFGKPSDIKAKMTKL
jgi:molybdenum transport protein